MDINEDIKMNKKQKKRKIFAFLLTMMIPISAAIITVDLKNKGINVNDIISGKFTGLFTINKSNVSGESDERVVIESVFKDKLAPIYEVPKKVFIESQNVSLDIIPVGVEEDGTMETPSDWGTAGWYDKSGKPGEMKNVVVNGHYDNNYGLPAAFYKIKYLNTGDKIEIEDKYGRIFGYKVVELAYLDSEDPSSLDVLKDVEGKSTLTLITCGGVWFPSKGYDKRLVVKAELINDEKTGDSTDDTVRDSEAGRQQGAVAVSRL